MPPVTRRSQHGGGGGGGNGGAAKKAVSRRPRSTAQSRTSSDSWEILGREGDDDGDNPAASQSQALANGHGEPRETRLSLPDAAGMDELREMAEKVGKQAESFAESLDQFLNSLAERRDTFNAVLQLVEEFKAIAKDAAQALEPSLKRERGEQLRREWSLRTDLQPPNTDPVASTDEGELEMSDRKAEQVEKSRRWQQEADIWELFQIVLESHHRPDPLVVRQQQEDALASMGDIHRYTPESELWDRFLLDNRLAQERVKIKTWLEQTAEYQETDLAGIVEELETKAKRGKGLWSSGWLYTREKIKGEKRLRSWPSAEESILPQIKRSDNNEMLITTLDPDAPARQDRTLEEPDAFFERAIWVACWEMLRRGKPWAEVSKWCVDRKEGWRAISIGKGADSSDVTSTAAWRKMCYLASQSGLANDYEAAVYGLLGGSIGAMQRVCRSVDDQLYAYYSATLLVQFDQYVAAKVPDRAPLARRGPSDELEGQEVVYISLINRLRTEPTTWQESIQPMKMIQSYLMANDLHSMVYTLGHVIAFTDSQINQRESMIMHLNKFWNENRNLPEAEMALDPQTLRIATHIAIILDVLRPTREAEGLAAEENVLVAYIQALRAAGKRDLIPTYASRLQKSRYVIALSRVLPDITRPSEQEEMLKLFEQYELDVVAVLQEQVTHLLDMHVQVDPAMTQPLTMLEPSEETKLYPGQRIIHNFLSEQISDGASVFVRSLQWFYMLHGHWRETFSELSLAMRKCLVAGHVSCAMSIARQLPYEEVSHRKTYQILGRQINLMDYDGAPQADEAAKWSEMIQQSKIYYELEQIVVAIKALSIWREAEYELINAAPRSSATSSVKSAKAAVDTAMEPILSGQFLTGTAEDEDEARDLAFIRTSYIPEIVLAYNTVLHTAGSIISRDALVESMDLSITIADEGNHISECFVNSGRMRELVLSFAQTSKSMLLMKELGGPRKSTSKSEQQGKNLGMWEIGPQGSGPPEERQRIAAANGEVMTDRAIALR